MNCLGKAFGANIDYAMLQKIYGAPCEYGHAPFSGNVHRLRYA